MLEHGEWRATAVGDGRTAGFHLSSLYSPVGWFSWTDAAKMYDRARKTPDMMKGFVNTVLGLPFEEEAEAPEWQRLYERREDYRNATSGARSSSPVICPSTSGPACSAPSA